MTTKRILYLFAVLLLIASGSFVFSAFNSGKEQRTTDSAKLFDSEVASVEEDSLVVQNASAEVPHIKINCTEHESSTSVSTQKAVFEKPGSTKKNCEAQSIRKLNANASINFLVEKYKVVDVTDTNKNGRKSFSVTFDSFSATLTKISEDPVIFPIAPVIQDLESSLMESPTFPGADLPEEVSGSATGTSN